MMFHLKIPYDSLLRMSIGELNDFAEWTNEQATGQSRLTEGHKEMVRLAKEEREKWPK